MPSGVTCTMTPDHRYITPEGRTYDSVTTVLGRTAPDKAGLEEWKMRMGMDVADYIMQQAARVGTAAHKMNENYLNNYGVYDAAGETGHNGSGAEPLLLARAHHENFRPYLERINNIRGNELVLWSDDLRLAGTTDCIAEYDGVMSIIDYKTKRSKQRPEWMHEYYLQASAYSMMYERLTGTRVDNAVILVSSEQDTVQVFDADLQAYRPQFLERLGEYWQLLLEIQPSV